jgi:hypothetical protein
MPALSFSGITSLGPFYELIRRGVKTTTLRELRLRPIESGDWLALYWKQRTPASRKPVHLIGETECVEVRRLKLIEILNDEAVIKSEGFGSKEEFWDWFLGENWRNGDPGTWAEMIGYALKAEFDLIRWRHPLD